MRPDTLRPPVNTYWISERSQLAGEYPGHSDEDVTRRKLEEFLDLGIRAFLDLTHSYELRPYQPTLEALSKERSITVQYSRMSIDDMGVPKSTDSMRAIQSQLTTWRILGVPSYVHCWGGVGRTGTVVACQLIEQGVNPEAALRLLSAFWQTMSPEKRRRYPQSPQTPRQVQYVRTWQPFCQQIDNTK